MQIDLLIPTRKRPSMLRHFVESVDKVTTDKDCITLNYIVDNGDPETIPYVKEIKDQFKHIKSEIHYVDRQNDIWEFNLNEQYYNHVAKKVKGDLLFVVADDLELTSPGWDEDVKTEVENFNKKWPDKIYSVSLLDNTKPPSHKLPKFACFPMYTREACEALGWILHPQIKTWGADYISYVIFQPIDRLLVLHDKNYINHISFHTKQVEVDETNKWIGMVFNQTKMRGGKHGMPLTDTIIALECPAIRNELKQKIMNFYKGKPEYENEEWKHGGNFYK